VRRTRQDVCRPVIAACVNIRCRYDLGSGTKVLRSREPITLGRFHALSAKRYGRDGVLRLDGGRDVSGVSPGNLRSLNVGMPLYLGNVANVTDRFKVSIYIRHEALTDSTIIIIGINIVVAPIAETEDAQRLI